MRKHHYLPYKIPNHVVLDAMREGKDNIVLHGHRVGLGSLRLSTFLNGTVCVHCGREGHHFRLEKVRRNDKRFHLNLYHVSNAGKEHRMTSDHIIALANGGSNGVENRQPMCEDCNSLKSDYDTIEDAIAAKAVRDYEKTSKVYFLGKIHSSQNALEFSLKMLERGDTSKNWKNIKARAINALINFSREYLSATH